MPMTWSALRALWDERDNRYRYLKGARRLGQREADAVRDYRRCELALLPATERPFAVAALSGWVPPVPLR